MNDYVKLTSYELCKLATKRYIAIVFAVIAAVYMALAVYSATTCEPSAIDYAAVTSAQDRAIERATNNLAGSPDSLTAYERNYQLEIVEIYSYARENLPESNGEILGWDAVLRSDLRAIFTCAIIILLVAELNLVERNVGFEPLLGTLKYGGKHIRRAKLSAGVIISVGAAIFPILVDLAVFALLGKLSSPSILMQYLPGFTLYPSMHTVAEYLPLHLFTSLIAAILFGLMIAIFSAIVGKYSLAYLIGGAITGGLFAFNLTELFGVKPIWSVLDLLSAMRGYPLLERYRAVNLLDRPLWLGFFLLAVLTTAIIAASIVYLRLKLRRIRVNLQVNPRKIASKARAPRRGLAFRPHLSLLRCELFKQLCDLRRLAVFALIIALKLVLADQAFAPLGLYSDDIYRRYATELEGPITDETYEYIAAEKEYIYSILDERKSIDERFASGNITLEEYSEFSEKYNYAISHEKPLADLERQISYLEHRASLGEEVRVLYTTGWELYLSDGMDFALLLAILLIGGASFSSEYGTRSSEGSFAAILGSTKRGRRTTNLRKLASAAILSVVVTLGFAAIDLAVISKNYYLPLASASTHSVQALSALPAVSLGANVLLMTFVKLAAATTLATAVTILSHLTHRGYAAMLITAACALLPRVIAELGFDVRAVDFTAFMGFTPMYKASAIGFAVYGGVVITSAVIASAFCCREE